MADNTTLGTASGGDTIRTLDKGRSDGAKTEVIILDGAGGDGRGERPLTFPISATLADVSQDDDGNPVFSLSPATHDALEILFRQLIDAIPHG